MTSLMQDLLKLGDGALPSELPSHTQVDRVLSSIVKVLEHEGLTVAEELFPVADVAAVAAAAAPAATAEATKALEALVARVEAAAAKVTGHQVAADPPPVIPAPPLVAKPAETPEDPAAVIANLEAELAELKAAELPPVVDSSPFPAIEPLAPAEKFFSPSSPHAGVPPADASREPSAGTPPVDPTP